MNPGSRLSDLLSAPVRPGSVTWIGLRPGRREPLLPVKAVTAEPGTTVDGGGHHRLDAGERGVTVLPADVVLDGGDLHASSPFSRATASCRTSSRLQNVKRTKWAPRAGSS